MRQTRVWKIHNIWPNFHLLRKSCCRPAREPIRGMGNEDWWSATSCSVFLIDHFRLYFCLVLWTGNGVIHKTRWRTNTIRPSLYHLRTENAGKVWHNQICQRLKSPGIDSSETIPAAYVAWRANTTTLFITLQRYYLHMMAESIPRLLKHLQIRALAT